MKKNTYRIRGQLAGIAVLAAATLNGCGYRLTGEQEPETKAVIDASSLFANASAEMSQETQEPSETQESSMMQESSEAQEPSAVEGKFWYDRYAELLGDWTLIENYGDFHYLPMYFGEEDYAFDSYCLCDVDQNGVPELFLHSSTMDVITAAFTCTEEQLVFLTYDDFYGINLETGELLIHGHWHGAGGTYINEWTAYKVLPDKAEYSMYIDFIDSDEVAEENRYAVYHPETDEYVRSADGTEYEALYAAHVQPCITVDNYILYDISDLSGLDRIQ